MAIELQNDTIRMLGRKFSMTHCFWINAEVFPLTANPDVDLKSAERWLSPLSIEDAMKTELFQFIPKDLQQLMANKSFGNMFCTGVQTSRCESVSDVKGSAASIFELSAEFFIQGYSRFEEEECRGLLLGPNGKYTKFAPVLFPDPKNMCKDLFLKTATLVKAIFVLSGDPNFYQVGKKTGIPYNTYLNYFRQQLLSGTPWAKLIFKFFDDALFPDSSNSAPSSSRLAANIDDDLDWEAAFERAFADGGPSPQGQAPGPASASAAAPPATADNPAQSISAPIVPNIAIAAIAAPVINNSVSAPFNPAAAAIPAP
ncbi:hypothetical protein EV363DRAFT_1454944 [Boletus edulis]|nr:hypothetical protein EV363DRAFT_1454944 [Boletus edulis]